MSDFTNKVAEYLGTCTYNMYILEVEKECGYNQWVFIFKNDTIRDMVVAIRKTFMNEGNIQLSVQNSQGLRMVIPIDNNQLFREFMTKNSSFFTPLYPSPANVVYKIYYEDRDSYI